MNSSIEKYLDRLRPYYRELFRIAHAAAGNAELAEFALTSAITRAYRELGERAPFREGLKRLVIAKAVRAAREGRDYEIDWTGFELSREDDARASWLAGEPQDAKRVIMLRYGLLLGAADISDATRLSRVQIRKILSRESAKFERLFPQASFERVMVTLSRQELARPDAPAPDMGAAFRSFEADVSASGEGRRARSVKRVAGLCVAGLLSVLLAFAFWVCAVIVSQSLT